MSAVTKQTRNSISQAVAEVSALLGDRLSTSGAVREQHGNDLTWNLGAAPDAVAFVKNIQEIQSVVRICSKYDCPLIPFGTGTSLEGHFAAYQGGICLDVSQMQNIINVNADDLDCRVEAGVTRNALNTHLRDTGLFFPIDPGADASLGGMAATRASGTNAVRYGTMRDNVLSLTAVMPNGEIVRTASRAKKSSAGYDLTRLLVGSEGTLGVIAEVGLKLYGIPESILAGVCTFNTIDECCRATIMAIQIGLPIARIELIDHHNIKAINVYSKMNLEEKPTLFLEFHGTPLSTKEQVETFAEIAAECGGGKFDWAEKEEDRNNLWKARHDAFWATKAMMPDKERLSTDVCVPISRLAECVAETQADFEQHNLFGPIIGHVGDGNFHCILFCDRDDAQEVKKVNDACERLALRAIAMEGTCTGEHGVGVGKMKYLEAEHGAGLAVMRTIKKAIDPQNIMNPGKIIKL